MAKVVYATACCGDQPVGDGSFTPLQVHYAERFSAAGRTRCVSSMTTVYQGEPSVQLAQIADIPTSWCTSVTETSVTLLHALKIT